PEGWDMSAAAPSATLYASAPPPAAPRGAVSRSKVPGLGRAERTDTGSRALPPSPTSPSLDEAVFSAIGPGYEDSPLSAETVEFLRQRLVGEPAPALSLPGRFEIR